MRRRTTHGFTLIEILTVVVIILIIAGWIVSAFASAQARAARNRAQAEITLMSTACENFKSDYGSYPSLDGTTESSTATAPINPRTDGNPTTAAYQKSSLFLYASLSGDADYDNKLTPPDEPSKGYMNFEPRMLDTTKNGTGAITKVNFIKDPFGYSYGYSTAAAKAEADYRTAVATQGAKATRATKDVGFNPTFDLWSTGGKMTATPTDADRNTWAKNW